MTDTRLDRVVLDASAALRPPPILRLSEWADANFVLSHETAAEPGRWHTLPYQREILDSISDDDVTQVSVMKSARVGYTLCMSAAIGYYMSHDPSTILVVQPTVDDAKNYSKETIAPMLRDVPVLSRIAFKDLEDKGKGPKDPTATLTHKAFPGGVLSLIGANSGSGFRRISRRVVMFDEVDAYPPSAGSEGDPISLGIRRSEAYYNRKIIAGSTPLVEGASRISQLFEEGDQRRYHVPCPHCGHLDYFTFREGERGHWMRWDKGKPETACFVCRECGGVMEHSDKRRLIEAGRWIADKPGGRHRSYHLWAALSYAPNATWAHIAADFLAAKDGGPERLRTFANTSLGETWQERGEAPEWERLFGRRERYTIGSVPAYVEFLTAGVDVQRDRLVFEVVGWNARRESWTIDAGVLLGDTSSEATWAQADALLARTFVGDGGRQLSIALLAVDSGYNTQEVYSWARRYPMSRVVAIKGASTSRTLIGVPSPVDITARGKRHAHGYKVWPVGSSLAKGELYGWLRLAAPETGQAYPIGFCHFPELAEEYFRQLTAEHLVSITKRNGFVTHEWQVIPGRENHWLDCRVYARAAAAILGLDRLKIPDAVAVEAPAAPVVASSPRTMRPPTALEQPPAPRPEPRATAPRRPGSWLSGGRNGRPGGWLARRT